MYFEFTFQMLLGAPIPENNNKKKKMCAELLCRGTSPSPAG
jgi:hypothetical protein